jgi:hypothetical protein
MKKMGSISNSLAMYIVKGGIPFNCFYFGFIVSMILTPFSSQGPMPGIFITGAGFLIGLIGVVIYWLVKEKNKQV